jgi:hypothetical protein
VQPPFWEKKKREETGVSKLQRAAVWWRMELVE